MLNSSPPRNGSASNKAAISSSLPNSSIPPRGWTFGAEVKAAAARRSGQPFRSRPAIQGGAEAPRWQTQFDPARAMAPSKGYGGNPLIVAGGPGFEPRLPGPEPGVLP